MPFYIVNYYIKGYISLARSSIIVIVIVVLVVMVGGVVLRGVTLFFGYK
jgi:hypothetical protein